MCGIGGLLLETDQQVSEQTLQAMGRAMTHRGPDASGVWTQGSRGFSHTRLRLFDLSTAADQPWVRGDDALVFNGEIYNFRELRSELEWAGHTFTTTSDTEVLFVALQHHGLAKTLDRIRGMFAFAYHCAAEQTTYLCRDRFGIKPLLYGEIDGGIAFASEAKALAVARPLEVDETLALLAIRTLGDKSQDRTLFRGVRQVAPGSFVVVRSGRVVGTERYAPLLDLVDEARYRALDAGTYGAAVAELDELLRVSVDGMASCDANLGVFLSGGVDSGLLASLGRTRAERFRAFTSDVRGPSSELAQAVAVAGALSVPIASTAFEPGDWLGEWVQSTWHLETPVITNPSTLPFGQVAQLAHDEGYQAVLTGEGADELFLGYPRLASGAAERLAAAPLAALRSVYGRVPGLLDALMNDRDARSNDFLRGVVGGFEEDLLRSEAEERYGFLDARQAKLQATSVVMTQTSLQALLQRNDRMGMAASIESRFPFLDEEVVAFALNLPTRFKLRRSFDVHNRKHPFVIDKAIVRSVADTYLPAGFAMQQKKGFPTRGLHGVLVRPGAFDGGWAAERFGDGISYGREIASWPQAYDAAKLMSIEIFGRLFAEGQSQAEVHEWVCANAKVAPLVNTPRSSPA